MVTGVIHSPPRFLPSIFIAHRVQQSHSSSIVHRVLLTHVFALSASQFVHKKKSQRIYASMHSAGLELTKLTYTRLEDNLIRHRGDRLLYCTMVPSSAVGARWHGQNPQKHFYQDLHRAQGSLRTMLVFLSFVPSTLPILQVYKSTDSRLSTRSIIVIFTRSVIIVVAEFKKYLIVFIAV